MDSLRPMLVEAASAGRYKVDPMIPFELQSSEQVFNSFVMHYLGLNRS